MVSEGKSGGLARASMAEGSPFKLLLTFSIPLLLGNVLQQTYNIVDTIVVGNFMGSDALAAVGLSFSVIFLFTSLFMGLSMGATIIIAQYFGAGDMPAVRRAISTVYIFMMLISLPVALAGMALTRPLLLLLNTPENLLPMSETYMRIIFIGMIPSLGYNINAGILQGLGDSRTSLYFLTVACVVNIILDLLLVTVFKLGVEAIAIATVAAQTVAFVTGCVYINKRDWPIRIKVWGVKPDFALLGQAVRLGLPSGIQNIMFSFGAMVMQSLINSNGPAFIAGAASAGRIDSFCFMPMMSFSMAITTFTGQNIGAGNQKRAMHGLKVGIVMSLAVCVVIILLIMLFGRQLLAMFNGEPDVIAAGWAYLVRIVPFFPVLALMFMLSGMLRGAGASFVPMVASMVSMWLARVPLAYLFAGLWGGYNMWFSFPLGWLLGVLLLLAYIATGRWKNKSVTRTAHAEETPSGGEDTAGGGEAALRDAADGEASANGGEAVAEA